MSNRLAQAQLALLCCQPWEFLKRHKLRREIETLEAIEGNPKPWRRREVVEGIIPSCKE